MAKTGSDQEAEQHIVVSRPVFNDTVAALRAGPDIIEVKLATGLRLGPDNV